MLTDLSEIGTILRLILESILGLILAFLYYISSNSTSRNFLLRKKKLRSTYLEQDRFFQVNYSKLLFF